MEGKKPQNWRTSFFYHYYDQFGVPEILGLRTDEYKLIRYNGNGRTEWEFYDIKKDPDEMKNKIGDPELSDVIDRLKVRLRAEQQKYESRYP